MRRVHIPFFAIVIASSAGVFIACSDGGYQGVLPGTGGGGGSNASAGRGGDTTIPSAGSATGGSAGSTVAAAGSSGALAVAGSVGSSGATATGGTGGSGGTTASGGSGGAPDLTPKSPISADMLAHKWRYTHGCKFLGGQPISNFPTCSEGNNDICHESADSARWFDPTPPVWKFGGDPDKVYEIKIRLRAVSEPKTYKNCKEVNTRTDNGKHPMICDGTGMSTSNPGENFNVLDFRLNDPRQDFYMNMAEIDEPHRVEKLDEVFTVKARGGSTASFLFDDLNGGQIRNCNKYTFAGMPDVAPYDNTAIDGQFWQWDCADPAGGDACWKVLP